MGGTDSSVFTRTLDSEQPRPSSVRRWALAVGSPVRAVWTALPDCPPSPVAPRLVLGWQINLAKISPEGSVRPRPGASPGLFNSSVSQESSAQSHVQDTAGREASEVSTRACAVTVPGSQERQKDPSGTRTATGWCPHLSLKTCQLQTGQTVWPWHATLSLLP